MVSYYFNEIIGGMSLITINEMPCNSAHFGVIFTTYGDDILSPTIFLVHGHLLYFNTHYIHS